MSKTVAVIGPGKAFGHEILEELHSREVDTIVFARNSKWGNVAGEYVASDLENDSEQIAQYIMQKNVNRVIFAARSGRTKDPSDIKSIERDIRIGALSAEMIYQQLAKTSKSSDGIFTIVGGDFGDRANNNYPGLSREKAVLHNFARGHFEETPPTRLVVIEGAVTTPESRKLIAGKIAEISLGEVTEYETHIAA